jgi:hypothetical protein
MQAEVYSALRSINIAEDAAIRAAEALSRRDVDVANVRTDVVLMKWMIGGIYLVIVPAAWLLIRVALKTGAL